jgi:hypothetical protein
MRVMLKMKKPAARKRRATAYEVVTFLAYFSDMPDPAHGIGVDRLPQP